MNLQKDSEFTFQVNISPGDVLYAYKSVRELAQHHLTIPNRLLIVDCCKPQKTKLVNPAKRFPEPEFSNKIKIICELAEDLLKENLFTEVYYIKPNDKLFKVLSKKYLNNIIKTTHGAGGTAQMAYWAGIELAKTRYVIHYDGDMILHQDSNFHWWEEAKNKMLVEKNVLMAIPRHAPPTTETGNMPTYFEGTEMISKDDYWIHNWFSTRVFLLDKEKLSNFLPLVIGEIFFELILRKLLLRSFPLDPEIIFFRKLGLYNHQRRLILKSAKAWTLHPLTKSKLYIDLLSKIYLHINNNSIPVKQGGHEDLDLKIWSDFLNG